MVIGSESISFIISTEHEFLYSYINTIKKCV